MTNYHIMHIIPSLAPGGAEQILLSLTRALTDEFQHTILTLYPASPQLEPDKSTAVTNLMVKHKTDMMRYCGQFRKFVKTARADLIHGWMYHANLLGVLTIGLKTPQLWSIHNALNAAGGIKPSTTVVSKLSAKMSSAVPRRIVYCSHESRRTHEALGYCPQKSVVIQNSVDGERFYPQPSQRAKLRKELGIGEEIPLFGRVARYDPQKDFETFFAAAERVGRDLPKARFLLCGDRVTKTNRELLYLAEQRGVSQRCHFLGLRLDMLAIYNAMDLLISSSSSEASPVSLLEAMACGIPVCATDVGDCARLVGDAGKIVEPRNPAALATAMMTAYHQRLRDPHRTAERCRRQSIGKFGTGEMARQYGRIYRDIVSGATPGR